MKPDKLNPVDLEAERKAIAVSDIQASRDLVITRAAEMMVEQEALS